MLLSPEVVGHILSFLRADISTLKSCSQAHSLLSAQAERYLYYTITVNVNPGGDTDITELSRRLSDNPHIRNYVRILRVHIFEVSVSGPSTMMDATLSILSSLPLLNIVTLSSSQPTVWGKIHKNFQLALVDILHQSSVRELCLDGLFGFPLSVLDTSLDLKTLSFSNFRAFTRPDSSTTCPPLESLSIRGDFDRTLSDWAIHRVSRLTCLKIGPHVDLENSSEFPKLLEACSGSLTSLELDIGQQGTSVDYRDDEDFSAFPEPSVDFPFSLSVLAHMEHLTIWAVITAEQEDIYFGAEIVDYDFVFYSAIHAITSLIESSATSLRQVVLNFFCDDFAQVDSLMEVNWDPLIFLGQSPSCPHIDLRVCCRGPPTLPGFSPEDIGASIGGCVGLVDLVNRGVFSIRAMTVDDFQSIKNP